MGLAIAAGVTLWDWVQNPAGIFRGPEGTNWQFVVDTALSWFLPTFLVVAIVGALLHMAWVKYRQP